MNSRRRQGAPPGRNCFAAAAALDSLSMSTSMPGQMVYLNGRIVPAGQAAVSVFDAGFLHGASVFTTMLAHKGVVFRLARHLARLLATAEMLKLKIDATSQSLSAATTELVSAGGLAEARVRITLSPGGVYGDQPTTVITADPLPEYPPEWYQRGLDVAVTAFRQNPGDPGCGYKTGCYLPRMLARQEAAAKGCQEALWYTPDNRLAEACFCNVFLVLEGVACTPPLDTPVLPGIVREAVLELCDRLQIERHDDRPLTVREMLAAEEIFLTSSCAGVRPVARIERHVVADERPGPVTRKIMAAYRDLLETECGLGEAGRSMG